MNIKSICTVSLAAGLAFAGLGQARAEAETDELGLTPDYWYTFNTGAAVSQGAYTMKLDAGSYEFPSSGRNGGKSAKIYDDYGTWTGESNSKMRLPLTFTAWMKAYSQTDGIFFSLGHLTGYEAVGLASGGGNKVYVFHRSSGGTVTKSEAVEVLDATTLFHHYAIEISTEDIALYVDGVYKVSFDKVVTSLKKHLAGWQRPRRHTERNVLMRWGAV